MTTRTANPAAVDGNTTLAALAHASALVASLLGPILFLLVAEDDLVRQNAKNAVNFQIVVFAVLLVSGVVTTVLTFLLAGLAAVAGFMLVPLVGLISLALVVIGTVKANGGQVYAYPFTPDIV